MNTKNKRELQVGDILYTDNNLFGMRKFKVVRVTKTQACMHMVGAHSKYEYKCKRIDYWDDSYGAVGGSELYHIENDRMKAKFELLNKKRLVKFLADEVLDAKFDDGDLNQVIIGLKGIIALKK